MFKYGKCYCVLEGKVDCNKQYFIDEVVVLVKELVIVKFDEMVEVYFCFGIDFCKSDQNVCGIVVLLYGMGCSVCVVVIIKGENVQVVEVVGVDVVGSDELIECIVGGFMDFDVVVVIFDMMVQIGQKFVCLFGLCGLFFNFKSGIVGVDVVGMVCGLKVGCIEFCNDKIGVVYVFIGKVSFELGNFSVNYQVLILVFEGVKFGIVKGVFLCSVYLMIIMGFSILLVLGGVVFV